VSWSFGKWRAYRTTDIRPAFVPVSKPCGNCYSVRSSLLPPFELICPQSEQAFGFGFELYSIVKVRLRFPASVLNKRNKGDS
jgi:hypothetical protein